MVDREEEVGTTRCRLFSSGDEQEIVPFLIDNERLFNDKRAQLVPQRVNTFALLNPQTSKIGEKNRAREILRVMEKYYAGDQALGLLHRSSDLAGFALTAQLAGDSELALERMQSAVNAGWRDYYLFKHDPRWASVRDNQGFVELMAMVEEDIDRQRAEQEAIDASEDFEAQIAAALADHASRQAEISK